MMKNDESRIQREIDYIQKSSVIDLERDCDDDFLSREELETMGMLHEDDLEDELFE